MASQKRLPVVDEYGFYEIRLDSIGGLGAHLAGQILGEAAVLKMGLNALHFSSYGSEKKGSPIKSFLRVAETEQEIRSCSPVERPHLVAVFHDALLRTPGTLEGLRDGGILIVNTRKSLDALRRYGIAETHRVYLLDALTIAIEEKSRVNTAMMGAVVKASGFLDFQSVLDALTDTFERKHPSAVGPNERAFRRGFEELVQAAEGKGARARERGPDEPALRARPKFGYVTAPVGGCITEAGNSVLRDISSSRSGFLPVFEAEKCVQCGMCELVCPDYCLVWLKGGGAGRATKVQLEGIDYRYCKGCLRCVDSCPSGALAKQAEEEGFADQHRKVMFPELQGVATPPATHAQQQGEEGK